jgi:hypothetical protein
MLTCGNDPDIIHFLKDGRVLMTRITDNPDKCRHQKRPAEPELDYTGSHILIIAGATGKIEPAAMKYFFI